MTFDEYLDQFLRELQNRGITKGDPRSVNHFKKMAKIYRNACYGPKEAAELEAGWQESGHDLDMPQRRVSDA